MDRYRKQMRESFFDLSPEGVLVYQDPMFGPLANPAKSIAVVANTNEERLELRVRGNVERVFALALGAGQACQEAFAAYFATFASLCQEKAESVQAA